MIDLAYAQAVPGAGGPGPIMTVFPFILIFVIMYFMVIRPQQKEEQGASGDAQEAQKER